METVRNPTWSPVPTASGLEGPLELLTVTHALSALQRGLGGWATGKPQLEEGPRAAWLLEARQLLTPLLCRSTCACGVTNSQTLEHSTLSPAA